MDAWPAEPATPPLTALDGERFAAALSTLCGPRLANETAQQLAGWMLEDSRQFKVDPFLVAAVIFHHSRCRQGKPRKAGSGAGLARIHLAAHQPFFKGGRYRYWVATEGAWQERDLELGRFPFTRRSLRQPRANIYFTSALLRIYREQCADLDRAVRSARHRHHVSHLFWGDRVLGTRFEDLVLRARRRLLRYYSGKPPPPKVVYRGVPMHCPLDGAPRKVSSGYWDRRQGGARHRAMDFLSLQGEPVRALADGLVTFAGYDLPNAGAREVSPQRCRRVRRRRMGRGGLFVMIDHGNEVVSGYYHLSRFTVARGQQVKGGQLIGYVGRTGMKHSAAHLHFDMRYKGCKFNPFHHLRPYLLPPNGRHEVQDE